MGDYKSTARPKNPDHELAALLSRKVSIITATEVRELIRDHWSKINVLAHAIHEEEMAAKMRKNELERAASAWANLSKESILSYVRGQDINNQFYLASLKALLEEMDKNVNR